MSTAKPKRLISFIAILLVLTFLISACAPAASVSDKDDDKKGDVTNDDNTGDDNIGDDNTGDNNTGDDNTGDDNTGDDNTGDDNTGDDNTGDDKTGDDNTGDDNTGDDNTGDDNTGDDNTGEDNTGDDNTGDDNTGDDNTGDDNTGNDNTGDDNTGDDNTGDDNTEPEPEKPQHNGEVSNLNLPIVYITTSDGGEILDKENYSEAHIRFALTDRYIEYTNSYTDFDGRDALLRCRGNSTYASGKGYKKMSYKVKLEKKNNLFGMGKSKHWYLLGEIFDVTHMRNKLAYDMAGTLGMTYNESVWVVLYYNGEYRGIYALVESIRVEGGRIETFEWENFAEDTAALCAVDNGLSAPELLYLEEAMKDNLAWVSSGSISVNYSGNVTDDDGVTHNISINRTFDLTPYFDKDSIRYDTGYVIEYDNRMEGSNAKWKTSHGVPVYIDTPDAAATNSKMVSTVKTLIQDFEDAIYSTTFFNAKGKHYSEYLDVQSLVDFWMVWNLFNNIEFGVLSLYYYIDDGKIVFGPCWDFDNASGNIVTLNDKWMRWDYWVNDRGTGKWFRTIMKDPWFVSLCQERWFSMREAVDDMMQSLDIYHDYLQVEAIKCYQRTGPRVNWYLKSLNGGHSYDFETDFGVLKDWLTNRIKWIDTNLAVKAPNIDGSGFSRDPKVFFSLADSNGNVLPADNVTSYGTKGDYLISTDAKGDLTLTLTTTSTSATESLIYINGTISRGTKTFNDDGPTTYTFPASLLNLEDGALNVIYIIVYNGEGGVRARSSVNIRVSKTGNPTSSQIAVSFGGDVSLVYKGSSVKVPAITTVREGFTALGWTTGDSKVYKPGENVSVSGNCYFYVRWQRNDMESFMVLEQ